MKDLSIKELIQKHHEKYVEEHKDIKCICTGNVFWSNCKKCKGLYYDHIEGCSSFTWGWFYACDEKDGSFDPR